MIDPIKLENNFEQVAASLSQRGVSRDFLYQVRIKNNQRKQIIRAINDLRQKRNIISREQEKGHQQGLLVKSEVKTLEQQLQQVLREYEELCAQLPNIPTSDTPNNHNLVKREF